MMTMKRNALWCAMAAASAGLMSGCGGGDDGPQRGALLEAPASVATLSAAQIDAAMAAGGLQALTGKARCDVKIVALNYRTVDPKNADANVSGAMLVPTGAACSGPAPLVAYARGTDVAQGRTMASATDAETGMAMGFLAAQGYAVVLTDYLGYAKSTFPYHPYLHADSEAASVIDSIRAARNAAAGVGANLSGKVMLAGYSQGGHAASAAQRNGERDNAAELNIVGAALMGAPFNVSDSARQPIAGVQVFVPLAITAWQKTYGNIYTDVNTVFRKPYADTIENLIPSRTLNVATMVASGALPGANGESPEQARAAILQPAFLADYVSNNQNPVYLAAKRNDLMDWTPRARTLLCQGSGDPTIPYALNQKAFKALLDARGATHVTAVDVDAQVQATFGTNGAAPTDPANPAFAKYYGGYHGSYAPPFCFAQARALFDTVK